MKPPASTSAADKASAPKTHGPTAGDPAAAASVTEESAPARAGGRLLSLDQFRGYTVAAMFAVNFIGGYTATPAILRHYHTWCSFADTVMPQFLFAAGMALRLVTLREIEKHGKAAAMRHGIRRGLSLMLLGFVWYGARGFDSWQQLSASSGFDIVRNVFLTSAFEALTHIGATSLWVLPVIASSSRARWAWMLGSAGLHVFLSWIWWYAALKTWGIIDGGPLGFLTWTLPFLAGSLALDAVRGASNAETPDKPGAALPRLLLPAAVLMTAGYLLACLTAGGVIAAPPFVPPWHPVDMWTMSQRAGSVSYLTFCAGFSLAVFALFHWWSDLRGKSLTLFADLGRNALAAYLIHSVVMNLTEQCGPKDSPLWWAMTLSTIGFLLSWQFTRWLNARSLYLRL